MQTDEKHIFANEQGVSNNKVIYVYKDCESISINQRLNRTHLLYL